MARPERDRDLTGAIASFVGGFLLAFLLIYGWLTLAPGAGRGRERVVTEIDTIRRVVEGEPRVTEAAPREPEAGRAEPTERVREEAGRTEPTERMRETERGRAGARARTRLAADGLGRGEIGAAERSVVRRLAAAPVPTKRLAGDLNLRAWNVTWTDGRRPPFARIAYLAGTVDVAAAERGDVVVNRTTLRDAEVLVEQPSPNAEWNYERVFADLLDGGANGAARPAAGRRTTFRLNDLTLQNVTVRVRYPGTRFTLADVDAQLPRLTLSAPGLDAPELTASRVAGTYIDETREGRLAFTLTDAAAQFPTPFVEFKVAGVTLENSRFQNILGTWGADWPGLGVRLAGRGTDVRFADLRFFSPRIPEEGGGSFDFEIAPVSEAVTEVRLANADIRADGSRITGAVHARIGGPQTELISVNAGLDPLSLDLVEQFTQMDLPYSGLLRGSVRGTSTALSFDVLARLTTAEVTTPFEARGVGIVALTAGGLELRRLTAELRDVPGLALRPVAPGLPLRGNINGTVTLTGPPNRAPLTLAVELNVAGGVAVVNGTLDLTGAVPAYDLTGRVLDIDLQALLQPAVPPAQLTANFAVRGRGTDPNTLDARIVANGRFSGWETQPRDTLALDGTLRGGTLTLADTARINMGPAHLALFGNWRFVEPMRGSLAYTFDVESLEELGPYVPFLPDTVSAGRLTGRGRLAGTLARLQVNGTVEGQDVSFGDWTAGALNARHDLVLGPAVPLISAEFVAVRISTPAAGDFTKAQGTVRLGQPNLSIAFQADREDGSKVELTATGVIPAEGARRLVLQRFRLDATSGQWVLVRPSVIEWVQGGPIAVRNMEIRNTASAGLLRLDGTVYPIEQLNLRAQAENLPVAEVQRLLGQKPRIEGLLNANAIIGGPPAEPNLSVTFTLASGSLDGVAFAQAQGDIRYVRNALVAEATAVIDSVGSIELKASLPAAINLEAADKFALLNNGAVSGSLRADSLNMAPFERLFPELRDLIGYVTANATLSGTVRNPDLSGELRLVNGEATVLPLNQRYTQISGLVEFENRRAVIRELRARSDGWAVASGSVVFETLNQPSFDVSITLTNFRAMGVDEQTDAAANGSLRLTGAVNAPVLTGQVALQDGDVAVPSVGRNPIDEQLAAIGSPTPATATTTGVEGGFFGALRIANLRLRAGDGVWFDIDNARAQLSGELSVNKTRDEFLLTGTLQGRRGTFILEAGPILRRFEIVDAEVRFLGTPEINPALDITARRTIIDPSGRQVEVDVRIGGTLQTPTLSLASADAAAMGQEELLSFLLFGEQRIGLTGGLLPGGDILEETFFGGLAEIASIELERSLGMPFDIFQVRLGPGTLAGLGASTVVAGFEVSPNVFLTVEYGVGALFGDADISNNNYAVRLEWRIDQRTSLRAGYEPVNRGRLYRSFGLALPVTQIQPRQVTVEIRRRWNW